MIGVHKLIQRIGSIPIHNLQKILVYLRKWTPNLIKLILQAENVDNQDESGLNNSTSGSNLNQFKS